jgi:hypothetical protein
MEQDLWFGIAVLNTVVQNLIEPQSFLLDAFFTQEVRSNDPEIHVDIQPYRPRISPFVSPLVAGKVVASQGFRTAAFAPAYVKDKRVFTPNRAPRRLIGERFAGQFSQQERTARLIANDLVDQLGMWKLRLEVMASEALRLGRNTITGEDYPTAIVDYLRDASLTVVKAGAARWGQAGVSPWADVQAMVGQTQALSGAPAVNVVMDPGSATLFLKDPDLKDILKTLAILGREPFNFFPILPTGGGTAPVFLGAANQFKFWQYSQPYVDVDGVMRNVMPAGTVIGVADQVQGVRHFGKIADLDALQEALPWFVKSWREPDPSVQWILGQSAPLTVPVRSNATFCMTVY